ncbi:hypothetical protein C8034_v000052 [Colletotrichum sidae]|uniref:Uncharacterized protein n=1 Tax=Colletotrichum sidae TaxID=1347389 RepID=A0A4R8SM20_9PEZI|nr:hypothetical protein C8034_v000052 [Colletotrichum sidae]
MGTTHAGDGTDGADDANHKTGAPNATSGEKHNIEADATDTPPDAKRSKKSDHTETRQTTLEETLGKKDAEKPDPADEKKEPTDTEMKDAEEAENNGVGDSTSAKEVDGATTTQPGDEAVEERSANPKDNKEGAADVEEPKKEASKADSTKRTEPQEVEGKSAEIPHKNDKVPSNVLEKGIVYFFFRARVNTDKPEEVDDIARSYIILRPIAPDSKLGDGPIGDAGNTRLLALPKKVLPQSGRDRFMVFVEKSGPSFAELKGTFLSGAENDTKAGTSHVPAATPAGEGVYVITTTGRESHLVYKLTIPSDLGEVQNDLGLKQEGSFILSTKNPKFPGPANARLPEAPDFTQEIKDEFRDLRWTPSRPEHLDFANAQILMIGESDIEKATEPRKKDVKEGKDEPKEVLEDIEEEDTKRMEHLADDDSAAIFADLQASAENYPKLQTTF